MWPPKVNILKVDLPRENGRGWKRTSVEIDAQDPALGAGWREPAASGAKRRCFVFGRTYARWSAAQVVVAVGVPSAVLR